MGNSFLRRSIMIKILWTNIEKCKSLRVLSGGVLCKKADRDMANFCPFLEAFLELNQVFYIYYIPQKTYYSMVQIKWRWFHSKLFINGHNFWSVGLKLFMGT